jgi:hypothetical protein
MVKKKPPPPPSVRFTASDVDKTMNHDLPPPSPLPLPEDNDVDDNNNDTNNDNTNNDGNNNDGNNNYYTGTNIEAPPSTKSNGSTTPRKWNVKTPPKKF